MQACFAKFALVVTLVHLTEATHTAPTCSDVGNALATISESEWKEYAPEKVKIFDFGGMFELEEQLAALARDIRNLEAPSSKASSSSDGEGVSTAKFLAEGKYGKVFRITVGGTDYAAKVYFPKEINKEETVDDSKKEDPEDGEQEEQESVEEAEDPHEKRVRADYDSEVAVVNDIKAHLPVVLSVLECDNLQVHGVPVLVSIQPLLKQTVLNALNNDQHIPFKQRVQWLLELAEAVKFLTSTGYVHADIRLDNAMLDDAQKLRLIDVGNAVKIGEQYKTLCGENHEGTDRYPEVFSPPSLENKICTCEVKGKQSAVLATAADDVYRVGVAAYQMFAGYQCKNMELVPRFKPSEPKDQDRSDERLWNDVEKNCFNDVFGPNKLSATKPKLRELILNMMRLNGEDPPKGKPSDEATMRPTPSEVVTELKAILATSEVSEPASGPAGEDKQEE